MRVSRRWTWVFAGTAALALFVSMVAPGASSGALASSPAAISPQVHHAKDPTVVGKWVGYGLHGRAGTISYVAGTWIQPASDCPAAGIWSEAIGAGLNAFPAGGRIDGAGTLLVCIYGVADLFTWYDESQTGHSVAAVLTPGTFSPGDVFGVNVTCFGTQCNYNLFDGTTGQSIITTWTFSKLPLDQGECVVMRGTSLGLPSVFAPIPTIPNPSRLNGSVFFGSHFTGDAGCWTTGPGGPLIGLGGEPSLPAGYSALTFELSNPPPAGTKIAPQAPVAGIHGQLDSFAIQ